MHIAIDARAIGSHFPGVGRATLGLLRGLSQLDHAEAITVVYPREQRALLATSGATADPRFRFVPLDAGPLGLSQQWRVPALARSIRPAIWHAPYYFRPFWGLPPVVVTIFDIIGPAGGRARLLWHLALRLSVRGAAHIITSSEYAAQELRRAYQLGTQRLSIVPLAPDPHFRPQARAVIADARRRYRLPGAYIIYLGSNKPHKNLLGLIDAWAKVAGASQIGGGEACLVIAGREDPRYGSARAHASRLGLAAHVRFLPDVPDEDLPALLSGALCFVFPSLSEGFGLPPLEAMACGTPVVCSNRTSLPEVVGDAGLLVDPTPEALAGAIVAVLRDDGVRSDLRQRGLRRAAELTWKRSATATLAVYRMVARRR